MRWPRRGRWPRKPWTPELRQHVCLCNADQLNGKPRDGFDSRFSFQRRSCLSLETNQTIKLQNGFILASAFKEVHACLFGK
jgi:hypothetical protein